MPSSNPGPSEDDQLNNQSKTTENASDSKRDLSTVDSKPSRRELIAAFFTVLRLLPVVAVHTIRFLLFHREVSLRKARLIRALFLHDRQWEWWHIGFTPWFIINWMLMTYDEKKESLSVRIKACGRAMDAISNIRRATIKDEDMRLLLDLTREFKLRSEAEFVSRDRKFFMKRMGSVINDAAKVFLENALLLRTSDYLVLKYLCGKACRVLDTRLRKVGIYESEMVTYFIEHKAECCQCIQHFKPMLLNMARNYVNNMISFCLNNDLKSAAHLWAQAGKCIIHLQELEPTDDNEEALLQEIDKFISLFDQASNPVYVKYLELDKAEQERQQALAMAAPDVDKTSEEGIRTIVRWPYLHREKLFRFKFKWTDGSLTITDYDHRESDHTRVKFENITAPQMLDILNELMKAFDEGAEFILPLNNQNWQASMKGAAADFIRRETETFREANPNASKEVLKFHNRHRRIILDGRDLRE